VTSLTSVRLLTPGQVAVIFNVDPQTVSRWNRTGRLDAVRTPGGHRRFREDDVRALLNTSAAPAR
jgi:excisionase family DNA binding protein